MGILEKGRVTSPAPMRSILVNGDKYGAVFNFYGIGANRRDRREMFRFTGPDVEPPTMPRTFDDIAMLVAFGQGRFRMTAQILGGIDFVLYPVQRNIVFTDDHQDRLALPNLVGLCHRLPSH